MTSIYAITMAIQPAMKSYTLIAKPKPQILEPRLQTLKLTPQTLELHCVLSYCIY